MKTNTTTGSSLLVRPEYGMGQLIGDDDLRQAVDYTRDLNRLIFRSLLGCGVVCGLKVKPAIECGKVVVTVSSGLALDCHGDPVYLPEKVTKVSYDPGCDTPEATTLWVLVRRTERTCAPRSTVCAPDDDDAQWVFTRIRDGYHIEIMKTPPACACGDPTWKPLAASSVPSDSSKVNGKKGSMKSMTAASTAQATADSGSGGAAADSGGTIAGVKNNESYKAGDCDCDCAAGSDCEWIILARLEQDATNKEWKAEHRVRLFIRPKLQDDPGFAQSPVKP